MGVAVMVVTGPTCRGSAEIREIQTVVPRPQAAHYRKVSDSGGCCAHGSPGRPGRLSLHRQDLRCKGLGTQSFTLQSGVSAICVP